MNKLKATILGALVIGMVAGAWGAKKAVLELSKSVPLASLHDGDFDHFAVDLSGHRLFSAAEENSKLLVFDLGALTIMRGHSNPQNSLGIRLAGGCWGRSAIGVHFYDITFWRDLWETPQD